MVSQRRSSSGTEMVTRNGGQIETPLETHMSMLRKTSAIALLVAMSGTMAHAEPKLAAKDIVIVHGALVDASGWRAVHYILTKDGFHVTIVQEPLTSLRGHRGHQARH